MSLYAIDDLQAIYPRLAPQLERIVVSNLSLCDELLEEACQVAWGELALRRVEVAPGRELGWLATTAIREALKLMRAARRDVSLDDEEHRDEVVAVAACGVAELGSDESVEQVMRLAAVHQLPVRQRRMALMQGFGFGYREIAAQTRDSRRTVERQLLRAKAHLREVTAD